MTTSPTRSEPVRSEPTTHPGPPLAAPALAFLVTFAASIAIGPITGAGGGPSPFDSGSSAGRYFAEHSAVTAASSWLMLLSSFALLVLSAVLGSRLAFLAPRAAGPVIVGVGGAAAAVLLGASAGVLWVLSQDPVNSHPVLARTLRYVDFVLGGPAHTAALGLLVLGVAITSMFIGRTSRVLAVVGIVLAVVDFACTVTLLADGAALLIPIGRFLSIIWIVVVAFVLPKSRVA